MLEAYDEARSELDHMRQGYDRLRADRDYHCDRAIAAVAERDEAIARAERAEAALAALREAVRSMRERHDAELEEWALAADGQRNDRLAAERERNEAIARAERAEAQLAALLDMVTRAGGTVRPAVPGFGDFAAAAEAHDRRARAEALREAAEAFADEDDGEPRGTRVTAKWLRARADEIERGER